MILGTYPAMSLRAARAERDRQRVLLGEGRDPLAQRALAREQERRELETARVERQQREVARRRDRATVEKIAGEWIDTHRATWTHKHADQIEQSLRDYVYPKLGGRPVAAIDTNDILAVLGPLLDAGKLETAQRVKQRLGAIFEFAALRRYAEHDPVALIKREFSRRMKQARRNAPRQNFATVATADAPALFRALAVYPGSEVTRSLVWFVALTACRTGEARAATWDEFDLEGGVWQIPAPRMKARRAHEVPLSKQAVAVLRGLPRRSQSTFSGTPLKADRPASENAVLYVLAAIGFRGAMTGHGFRSLFSTLANESGLWRPDVIEAALAHVEDNATRAAYLRSTFLKERAQLMQWWGNEVERLTTDGQRRRGAARTNAMTRHDPT